jgi:hypothetical protein
MVSVSALAESGGGPLKKDRTYKLTFPLVARSSWMRNANYWEYNKFVPVD